MNAPRISPHDKIEPQVPFDWRQYLKVHPAADLFQLLPEAELKELSKDIKVNGLRTPIVTWASEAGGSPVDLIRRALMRDSQGRPNGPLGAVLDLLAEDDHAHDGGAA
jgi:hypothetical protein